jgi:hypothetical protein
MASRCCSVLLHDKYSTRRICSINAYVDLGKDHLLHGGKLLLVDTL